MPNHLTAPKDLAALREEIVRRHESMSPRLQQVAQFALDHPNDMGLETLAVIAERCQVQPSTVVRFAKALGYDGASDMQRLFRDEILAAAPSPSYAERIRQLAKRSDFIDRLQPHDLMLEFADSNIIALEHLKRSVPKEDLEAAVRLLHEAPAIYIVGLRRSFPVASYLAYALRHVGDTRAHLLDGVAGMLVEQGGMVRRNDLLVAISFRPYAPETAEVVEAARARGARLVAISDTRLSPVAKHADVVFETKDAEVRQFRSLTASLCLAQTLVISYAVQLERGGRRSPRA